MNDGENEDTQYKIPKLRRYLYCLLRYYIFDWWFLTISFKEKAIAIFDAIFFLEMLAHYYLLFIRWNNSLNRVSLKNENNNEWIKI